MHLILILILIPHTPYKVGRKAHAAVSIEAGKLKCKTED